MDGTCRPPHGRPAPVCTRRTVERDGRVAQRESASFTPRRSLVQTQARPPFVLLRLILYDLDTRRSGLLSADSNRQAAMCLGRACQILLVASVVSGCTPVAPPQPTVMDDHDAAGGDAVDGPSACAAARSAQRIAHADAYLSRLEALVREVRARRAAGGASTAEVARVQARLSEARARMARGRADLAISRAELAKATGRPPACASVR